MEAKGKRFKNLSNEFLFLICRIQHNVKIQFATCLPITHQPSFDMQRRNIFFLKFAEREGDSSKFTHF